MAPKFQQLKHKDSFLFHVRCWLDLLEGWYHEFSSFWDPDCRNSPFLVHTIFVVGDKRAKGKPFDGSSSSVIKSFTPAFVLLSKASHMAEAEDDDSGKYIASPGTDTDCKSHALSRGVGCYYWELQRRTENKNKIFSTNGINNTI